MHKNGLVMVITFPSSVVFALRLSRHLPPREGFWLAASQRGSNGKAFGRPHPMKQCAAPVFLPLLRGRWRGAPDEVVDVNERPLIRLFSLRSKSLPLRHSRIGARLKKPSRLAFSYASRPTGGEKAFGSALPSNAPRSVGFSLGWRSCHQARRAQMTVEGGGLLHKNGLVMVITSPSSVVFALRLSRHLPPREGFWLAASQRGSYGKAFGWPLPIKQ